MAAVQFITTCFSQRVASRVFSRALHLDLGENIQNTSQLLRLFLTGSSQLTENENIGIFHSVQCFIKESGRFALVEP